MIVTWLVSNWFGVLGLFAGAMLSVFIYLRQKKEKRPVYAIRNVLIIEKAKETFPSLQVHYKGYGDDLDNLSATILAIWNSGRETLRGEDIASVKPLLIKSVGDIKLLGANVIQQNNEASNAKCAFNKTTNQAILSFEYLDHKDGFVVEVLHTGTNRDSIVVEGKFKGCGDIKPSFKRRKNWFARKLLIGNGVFSRKTFRNFKFVSVSMVLMPLFLYAVAVFVFVTELAKGPLPVVVIKEKNYIQVPSSYRIIQNDGLKAIRLGTTDYVSMSVITVLFLANTWLGCRMLRSDLPRGLDQYEEHLR